MQDYLLMTPNLSREAFRSLIATIQLNKFQKNFVPNHLESKVIRNYCTSIDGNFKFIKFETGIADYILRSKCSLAMYPRMDHNDVYDDYDSGTFIIRDL